MATVEVLLFPLCCRLMWDCAINVNMDEIVYLHCHHQGKVLLTYVAYYLLDGFFWKLAVNRIIYSSESDTQV